MLGISVLWTIVFGHCWLARCHQLTLEDQDDIVEKHNHFRSLVQPPATNMRRMSWDDSLAVVAAGYITKCVWDHNPELEDLGENLYATTGPLNTSKAISGWYLEYLDYNYHNNSCEESKLCGHYTQVVWADTFLVGCSSHFCDKVEGLSFTGVTMLVCNYSPPGNFEGEWPYEEGEPCSNCPADLQHCENNICVAESPTERTREDLPPGTESPAPSDRSPTESPAPSEHSPTEIPAPSDHSPTEESHAHSDPSHSESLTTETDDSITPSDEGQPLSDTSSPPLLIREKEIEQIWVMAGGMSPGSSALLLVTLLLLTVWAST